VNNNRNADVNPLAAPLLQPSFIELLVVHTIQDIRVFSYLVTNVNWRFSIKHASTTCS
jgi:hypothetical protein